MPSTTPSEAEILQQVFAGPATDFSTEAARALLTVKFDGATTARIRALLRKNNRGTIDLGERLTLEKYLRVGQFLDLVHARARLALKDAADPR